MLALLNLIFLKYLKIKFYSFAPHMEGGITRDRIITKFKRNGHVLTKNGLEMIIDHLHQVSNEGKRLEEIITKANEMVIMNSEVFNESTLKLTLELISHRNQKGRSFSSFDSLMANLFKWTTFYVNPYENKNQFFVDRPTPEMFCYNSEDFLQMNLQKFKKIREHNISDLNQNVFMGVLCENYSNTFRKRIILQNQVNEIQLVFPSNFQTEVFLIPGLTYIARGEFKTKDLQLTVSEIHTPHSLPENKENLLYLKLKAACDNLLQLKDNLNFSVEDFKKYQIKYNNGENKMKPILIFGNFKINHVEINRTKEIVKAYRSGVQCIILMLDEKDHEEGSIDLRKAFDDAAPIYLIPHINSEGPRILPKIPVLRNDYNVKVTSNPARFSIQGRQCVFLNYPLINTISSKSISVKETENIDSTEMLRRIVKMMFSQSNIGIGQKVFWKQNQYLNISSKSLLFICDRFCNQIEDTSGSESFISVGNYQSENEFVCYLPNFEKQIQFCDGSK